MSTPRLALVALALLAAACAPGTTGPRPDLTLLFTGTVNGYVEPCGCVAGQIGGIDRIAGYVEDELAANPASLFVETGDLISERAILDEAHLKQLPLKAEAFFSVWGDLGCVAYAVGENELLTLGYEELQRLSGRHGVPVLCGNLVDASGEAVFQDYVIVERGGMRIGIFSLIAPRLAEPIKGSNVVVELSREVRRQGLRILPWQERAEAIIEELLPQTDLILCASHLGFDLNRKLARELPQVDLVFGGHAGKAERERYMIGNTPVLVSLLRGSRVDRVDWFLPDPDEYFVDEETRARDGNAKLRDASRRAEAAMEVEVASAEYQAIGEREMAFERSEFEEKLQDKVALVNTAERNLAALPVRAGGNRFAHVQTPMHRALRRSELALRAIDEYHDSLRKFWRAKNPPEERSGSKVFVGPQSCLPCHPRQYEFWKATRHSYALTALETTGQETDAECFYCHTVGFRLDGGFHRPGRHEGFENVQCAACHGPGGAHMAGGTSFLDPDLLNSTGAATCAQCHNKEHDPTFETTSWRKLPMVACPLLEPVEERTPLMRAAAAEVAAAHLTSEFPQWAYVVEGYQKAGLDDNALLAAESWLRERPKSKEAHATLGYILLSRDRSEEALRHFEFVARRDPNDVRGWDGLAHCLKFDDPERALVAAREAQSLDQTNPERVRTVAEVLIAQDRRAAAEELVRGYLEVFPQYGHLLTDLAGTAELSGSAE